MNRCLIVNADDFGYSHGRNTGILHCIKQGRVTSTSILVNGTELNQIPELIETASTKNTSLGLHFNITEGLPLSPNLETITDSSGNFLTKFGLRTELERGKVSKQDVAAELRLQIMEFHRLTGFMPSHIDGHQHIHVWNGVRDIFLEVMKEHDLRATRVPEELGIDECSWVDPTTLNFYKSVVREAKEFKRLCDLRNITYPDRFVGMQCMGKNMSLHRVRNALLRAFTFGDKTGDIVSELMVHPGFRSTGSGGCGSGSDDFDLSPDRTHELDFLCGPEFETFLTLHDIRISSYNDII